MTSIENAQKALVSIGNNTTINQTIKNINIETFSISGAQHSLSLDKDEMNSIKNTIQPALDSINEEIKSEKRKQVAFESVELEFKTVTRQNAKGTYIGWIKDIHTDAKKITFYDDSIKTLFLLTKSLLIQNI